MPPVPVSTLSETPVIESDGSPDGTVTPATLVKSEVRSDVEKVSALVAAIVHEPLELSIARIERVRARGDRRVERGRQRTAAGEVQVEVDRVQRQPADAERLRPGRRERAVQRDRRRAEDRGPTRGRTGATASRASRSGRRRSARRGCRRCSGR